jgi:hypothetical protein
MQPPFGAHSNPRAQQPRPGPHQLPPLSQDCACACTETNNAPATTTAENIVLRNIARLPPAFAIQFLQRMSRRSGYRFADKDMRQCMNLHFTRLRGAPDGTTHR